MTDKALTLEEVESHFAFDSRSDEEWKHREDEAAAIDAAIFAESDRRSAGGPGSGNFGHAGRPGEVGGSSSEIDAIRQHEQQMSKIGFDRAVADDPEGYLKFEEKAIENLNRTSRTAKGESNTDTSKDKPKLVVDEGDALAQKTDENFRNALRYAWDNRNKQFSTPEELHQFMDGAAMEVSDGLLAPGQGLYRTWDTPNNQAPAKDVPAEWKAVTTELFNRLDKNDPVENAAWLEKKLAYVHPWADGVGRTTKVLSGFILARAGKDLPTYPDRKKYYQEINKSEESWTKYFKSLF